ncbi:MAG: DUF4956 domain-containing protein [Corynebacterium sp.]|nr:DUF4956 domain-containing protein [Corynebacterium sp.]
MSTLESWFNFQDLSGTFSVMDVLITLVLSFLLTSCIGWVYQKTHRNVSYSQSFVQTMVLVGMIIAIIMLVVGSNIARAFSLVGALSVIRFRNAVKETRDVGFIFFAMCIGMATGTRFYVLAIVATIAISLAILVMFKFNWFSSNITRQVVKVRIPAQGVDGNPTADVEKVLAGYANSFEMISAETVAGGALTELTYTTEFRRGVDPEKVIAELRDVNYGQKALVLTGYDQMDV